MEDRETHGYADLEAAAILDRTPRNVGRPFTDDRMTDALLRIFGRTDAIRGHVNTHESTAILIELVTRGLARAINTEVANRERTDFAITRAGHHMRVTRLLADIELSNRVLHERERRERGEVDARQVRGIRRRAAQLVLAYWTAARMDALETFVAERSDDFQDMDPETLLAIHRAQDGIPLYDLIVTMQAGPQ